jgi:hypothetical protein
LYRRHWRICALAGCGTHSQGASTAFVFCRSNSCYVVSESTAQALHHDDKQTRDWHPNDKCNGALYTGNACRRMHLHALSLRQHGPAMPHRHARTQHEQCCDWRACAHELKVVLRICWRLLTPCLHATLCKTVLPLLLAIQNCTRRVRQPPNGHPSTSQRERKRSGEPGSMARPTCDRLLMTQILLLTHALLVAQHTTLNTRAATGARRAQCQPYVMLLTLRQPQSPPYDMRTRVALAPIPAVARYLRCANRSVSRKPLRRG